MTKLILRFKWCYYTFRYYKPEKMKCQWCKKIIWPWANSDGLSTVEFNHIENEYSNTVSPGRFFHPKCINLYFDSRTRITEKLK